MPVPVIITLTPDVVGNALRHLKRGDPILGQVIQSVGPFALKRNRGRYESLLRAIVSQQISGAAARSIWAKLETAAGTKRLTPEVIQRLPDESLRGAGISPQKLGYVRDLTERVQSRKLPLHKLSRQPDETVIEELVAVKGIGVWTAQMFLMFSLGRPDVLPHGDLGIQVALQRLYGLPDKPKRDECERLAEPWRPYATVASWYLWRSLESKPLSQ
ncbi:DNA-3-methyladenine glycosylase family protein [Planctomicrobium sp. SH664]|uniref:DNA-3-methyladenine glycosylase family protein n=1 Tax=Planctomicrobium sp. SH664 TaxID=3448125 RepID=UPI003F5C060E